MSKLTCRAFGDSWGCSRPTFVKKGGPWCQGHYNQRRKGEPVSFLRAWGISGLRDERGLKTCRGCGKAKPPKLFSAKRGTPDDLNARCKACNRLYQLESKYGLSLEEFDEKLTAQGDSCAVCEVTDPRGHGWYVDHDHSCCKGQVSCGKCVRGILCGRCNTALGMVGDNTETLERLVNYLEEYRK